MEVRLCFAELVLLVLLVASGAATEQQVLVLSSDKLPSIQPLDPTPAPAPSTTEPAPTGQPTTARAAQSRISSDRVPPLSLQTIQVLQGLQRLQKLQALDSAIAQTKGHGVRVPAPNLQALEAAIAQTKGVGATGVKGPVPSLQSLQAFQSLQALQHLQNLQGAVDRAKRSGNILQLLGGASAGSGGAPGAPGAAGGGLLGGGLLTSLLGSSSSNSAAGGGAGLDGNGPTYGNLIGTGVGLPMPPGGERSFDLQSFKRSLMGVLMQAVRAITGGVIALKGQLVRVKGQLLSAKGNIISASGEALSQFGRNIASNALSPRPPESPAPPPRPVYGPPSYVSMHTLPRPVYGPPMYSPHMATLGQLPIPRPMYGLPSQTPVFNIYSNAINSDQPRYQPAVQHHFPPPPPPAKAPFQPFNQYSSHSISNALNSYGPPAAGTPTFHSGGTPPLPGTSSLYSSSSSFGNGPPPSTGTSSSYLSSSSFGNGPPPSTGQSSSYLSSSSFGNGPPPSTGTSSSYSSSSSFGNGPPPSTGTSSSFPSGPSELSGSSFTGETPPQPQSNYGPPGPPLPPSDGAGAQELNGLGYPDHGSDVTFGAQEQAGQSADSYFKRNTDQGAKASGTTSLNALQGAHAGLLLLKPAKNIPAQPGPTNLVQDSLLVDQKQTQPLKQASYYNIPESLSTGAEYASPDFGSRIGETGEVNTTGLSKNDRIFSLLFGSKKPASLRPHPVTRALPPQVVAAASAQLAAQLDLAGRAPPRTAVAVSGPHGKFIMYHK